MGSFQWMDSSIIHASVCSLMRKKHHPKDYRSDTKYHMTLNIVFSAVTDEQVDFEE